MPVRIDKMSFFWYNFTIIKTLRERIFTMKTCVKCKSLNKDDNNFCNACGCSEFVAAPEGAQVPAQPAPAHVHKKDYTMYDLFTIFGFVSSIIGFFVIALVLEPLSLSASIAGFAKGKRWRGLAIAAIVIAAIGLLIRLFVTLYDIGMIPEWLITGTFEN